MRGTGRGGWGGVCFPRTRRRVWLLHLVFLPKTPLWHGLGPCNVEEEHPAGEQVQRQRSRDAADGGGEAPVCSFVLGSGMRICGTKRLPG
jgi:hypothetical protein